jgi:hypothetical protein
VQARAVGPAAAVIECACTADGVFSASVRPMPPQPPDPAAPRMCVRTILAIGAPATAWIATASSVLAAVFVTTLVLAVLHLIRLSRGVWKGPQLVLADAWSKGAGDLVFPQCPPPLHRPLPDEGDGWSGLARNAWQPWLDDLVCGRDEMGDKMEAITSPSAPGGLYFFALPQEEFGGGLHGLDDSENFGETCGIDAGPEYLSRSPAVVHYPILQPDAAAGFKFALPALLPECRPEEELLHPSPPACSDHSPMLEPRPGSPVLESLLPGCLAPDSSPQYADPRFLESLVFR